MPENSNQGELPFNITLKEDEITITINGKDIAEGGMNIRPEPLLNAYIKGHATGELITCVCGFSGCAGIYTDQAILLLDNKFLIIVSDPLSVPPIEELPDYTFKNYVVQEDEYREQVYQLAKQLVNRQHFFDYDNKYMKNYMRKLRILCSYVIQKHEAIIAEKGGENDLFYFLSRQQ